MKIQVKNLGILRQAEFELSDFTIICGSNNTGKTYATYALFGFLSFWWQTFSIKIPEKNIEQLLSEGVTELNISEYIENSQKILEQACNEYTKQLSIVFASSKKHFSESEFMVKLENIESIQPSKTFEREMGTAHNRLFSISKEINSPNISVSLIVDKAKIKIPHGFINRVIGEGLKEIIFSGLLPHPFIASAERTGAAIFRKELNFARNRLLEQIATKDKQDIDPFDLINKSYSGYALPVKENVDFTRQLEDLAKKDSFITKQYPELLNDFANIIGGEYLVTKDDQLYYVPKGKKIKLTMDESSSSVRSLLDIGFYLRHVANPGDLLMVDEPELNLHPENQRRLARLFAQLVNLGIKVYITTHSDYIIKELNTLIMLNQDKAYLKQIAKKEGYKKEEIISYNKIKVYIAEEDLVKLEGGQRKTSCQTLVCANINSEYGIEVRSFDKTIEEMNRIQEEIIWGEDKQCLI